MTTNQQAIGAFVSPTVTAIRQPAERPARRALDGRTAGFVVRSALLRAPDAAVVAFGAFVASHVHFGDNAFDGPGPWLIGVAVLLTLAAFSRFGVYRSWRGRPLSALVARTIAGWFVAQLGALALLPLLPDAGLVAWSQFAYWAGLSGASFVVVRIFAYSVLAQLRLAGFDPCNVAIVGDGAPAAQLMARLATASESGFRAVALYQYGPDAARARSKVPAFADLGAFAAAVRAGRVTELWFAMPISEARAVHAVLRELGGEIPNVRFMSDEHGFLPAGTAATELVGMPTIDYAAPPQSGGAMRAPAHAPNH